MVLRSFFAIDSESLVVTSSPNSALVGTPIINNSDMPNGTTYRFQGMGLREITLDDTRGGGNRFNDDQENNHVIVDGGGIVDPGTGVESESRIFLRQLDENGNPFGPEIEIFVLSKDGVTSDVWGVGLTEPLLRDADYVKVGGNNSGTTRYSEFITCFAAGTRIKASGSDVAVEDIRRGQKIWTKDAGLQPVSWIGSSEVAAQGAFAPVRIEAGVLGNAHDLYVSQQHRIWIESAAAELYFGHPAVLVAAKHLCGLPGVALCPGECITYWHFMFDRHQIVQSNGALTESFFLAAQSLSGIDAGPQAELLALFPDLTKAMVAFGRTAAPTLTAREAIALRPYLAA